MLLLRFVKSIKSSDCEGKVKTMGKKHLLFLSTDRHKIKKGKKTRSSPSCHHNQIIRENDIYELDDYNSTVDVLSCTNLDDIISKYSLSIPYYKSFGDALNNLMNEKNVSLAALTQMTGIDKTSIHCYIHDTRIPNLNYAVAICIALRLSYLQSIQLLTLCDITLMRDTRQNIMLRFFIDSSLFSVSSTSADFSRR